ncbi:MAG TPA: hypothetical protein VK636_06095 [Gemmatimonadaceae bacterium]|nr:hypothetical protein [Gemmatimonadaceae bacterium]
MVLTSLVTVWCLDCSAFEPLLDALLGARAGMMSCATMSPAGDSNASTVADAGGADRAAIPRVSAAEDQRAGFDCGCGGSCHAPNANASRVESVRLIPPPIAVIDVVQPISAVRVPLLPPPERAVA